jgi:hypothetical protein
MFALVDGEVSNPAKLWFLFTDLNKQYPSLEVVSKCVL